MTGPALRLPSNWAVELSATNADLDNLAAPPVGSGPPLLAAARYTLAAVLLSGECGAAAPPSLHLAASMGDPTAAKAVGAGVELLLGTEDNPHIQDTVVRPVRLRKALLQSAKACLPLRCGCPPAGDGRRVLPAPGWVRAVPSVRWLGRLGCLRADRVGQAQRAVPGRASPRHRGRELSTA